MTRLVAGLLVLGACSPATVGVPPSSAVAGTPVGPEAGYPTREAKAGAAASVPGVLSTSGPTPSPVRGHGVAGDPQTAPVVARETPTDGTTSPPPAAVSSVTASGEPFDPVALTAAHRTLPFGTLVEMAYTRSGGARSLVTVRINDRGPFVAGGIIEGVTEVRWRRVG